MVEREDEYTLIPAPVFAALQINAIFVLVEQPKIIAARRAGDLGRERPVLPIREIGRRQEAAVNQAKAIAAELRISFQQMSPVDEEQRHDLLSSPIWDVNS